MIIYHAEEDQKICPQNLMCTINAEKSLAKIDHD